MDWTGTLSEGGSGLRTELLTPPHGGAPAVGHVLVRMLVRLWFECGSGPWCYHTLYIRLRLGCSLVPNISQAQTPPYDSLSPRSLLDPHYP